MSEDLRAMRCLRCGGRPDLGVKRCPVCDLDLEPATQEHVKVKRQQGFIREFFRGIAYFPRGLWMLLSKPRLWPVAAVPALMNAAFLGLAVWAAYKLERLVAENYEAEIASWEGILWGKILWAAAKVLVTVAEILSFLVVPFLVAILFSLFGKLLFMPFMEALSARTERILLGEVREPAFSLGRVSSDLIMGLLDAIGLLILQFLLMILLIPVNFLPIFGSLLWFIVPGAVFASMDFTDLNFVRRRYGLRERARIWWLRRWRFIGFGLSFFAILATPYLNLFMGIFVIPVASVGGTLLFLELDLKDPRTELAPVSTKSEAAAEKFI